MKHVTTLPGEEWRTIPGLETPYEVSNFGGVRSFKQNSAGKLLAVQIRKRDDYRTVSLSNYGVQKSHKVHALVMAAFVGPRPDGMDIRHLDGDKGNNDRTNLAYGTRVENMGDMREHGTHANTVKTHCPRGHEYTEGNTYRNAKGARFCQACRRVRYRENSESLLAAKKAKWHSNREENNRKVRERRQAKQIAAAA